MNNNVTTTSDVVNIVSLPEDCVSKIISFTSPLDACRFSLVSTHLISATDSDLVWRTFLPSDYHHILSRSHSPAIIINHHPFKQLFRTLCHPLLLDGGNKIFKLEKCSGKKSYFLSARELSIIPRSNDTLFWCWKSNPQSRFSEVAELRTANWLEIEGKIRTGVLTQKTSYAAYLVINIVSDDTRAYGLDYAPSEVSIAIGNKLLHTKKAYLRDKDEKKHKMETLFYGNRRNRINNNRSVVQEEIPRPSKREDGWMEIELGEFFSGEEEEEEDQEIKMKLTEMGYQLKGGLIVEGIEVRPKTN